MIRTLLLSLFLSVSILTNANTILVKNIEELKKANKEAVPGDIIVLQNGEWNNVTISLNCTGTLAKPITFKAQTAGKVIITGNSKLLLGGTYITVDGLYFTRGFAGDDAIIKFRKSSSELANNCRLTNTVINDFNNPKRMDDNYWVMLYGKNNRIDHCSFLNKKNMGVLMAVILDDERSRENFHSIDHNYFGFRLPLASNTGEILRVGVSQHCEFNSNTIITDNLFEHCDGETEIISIKSGSNYVRNNIFKECQGSVVLRHGDNNTVENNIFLGNNKEGTGGVRVINKGQWVVNNLFYQCRGEWFRTPLSIMNGVPNSPANRYVAVTDALIANNSFLQCAPMGICIGSDTERSVAPKDVFFINNEFNNLRDSLIYNAYDDISGINFFGNQVTANLKQTLAKGFDKTGKPGSNNKAAFDSLYLASKTRLQSPLSSKAGYADKSKFLEKEKNTRLNSGAVWFAAMGMEKTSASKIINCVNAASVEDALAKNGNVKLMINLTGTAYEFKAPLILTQDVILTSAQKKPIKFVAPDGSALIQVIAGNTLTIKNVNLNLAAVTDFISSDTSGSSNHSNFKISNSHFVNLKGNFFTAAKYSVADSIIVYNNTFTNCGGTVFSFIAETDNKGLYNVEIFKINNNRFISCTGQILYMVRGGNDESTMGPDLTFSKNIITNCSTADGSPLIHNFGTQLTLIEKNIFTNSNAGKTLIRYVDLVRSVHRFRNNTIVKSGNIDSNKFVISTGNKVK